MNTKIRRLIFCALFAALTAVCSQIAIPLPWDVPFNLATFAVLLAGALLGPWGGTASMLVYLLLGAVGVPVFALFRGGLDRLVGPTGGYLIGYLFMALVVGLMIAKSNRKFYWQVLAMTVGTIVCYAFGTAWYMFLTHNSFLASLSLCVLPFLLGDVIKILLAAFLSCRLHPFLKF